MINCLSLQFTFGEVSAHCSPRHMIRLSTASEGHRTCVFLQRWGSFFPLVAFQYRAMDHTMVA